MKIMIVVYNLFGVGGLERATCKLANELVNAGHSVVIASLWFNASKPFFELHPGIEIVSFGRLAPKLTRMYLQLPFLLRRAIKNYGIDRVIVSDSQLAVTAGLANIMLPSNMIVWEHFHSQMGALFGSRSIGRLYASLFANKIVVLTEADKKSWSRRFFCKQKVVSIPNFLTCSRSSLPYNIDSKTVIAVGRYCYVKGFDLLVSAWALLPEHLRSDWTLKIFGPKSDFKNKVSGLVESLNLSDSVELHDATADIVSEYQRSAMFVLSSRQEPFGLVITEALANKLPVLAFNCPMGPMDILQNKYGICVPAEDISALAEQMQLLMEQPELRKHFSDNGFERSKDYTEEQILVHWLKLL